MIRATRVLTRTAWITPRATRIGAAWVLSSSEKERFDRASDDIQDHEVGDEVDPHDFEKDRDGDGTDEAQLHLAVEQIQNKARRLGG